ncbi:MAG: rRNA maturation RNase YbeY [Candidatus Aureabacteria bacterium]|nr:rRNA maturation RNase YbeY [Candidatus Auribacterota bacterium]
MVTKIIPSMQHRDQMMNLSSVHIRIFNRQTSFKLNLNQLKSIASFIVLNERELYILRYQTLFPLKEYEFTISLLDEKKMISLHSQTLGLTVPTDVLSYSYIEPGKTIMNYILGEVFVCVDQAQQNFKLFHSTLEREIRLYLVHGILHCFGYDDTSKSLMKVMRQRERFYMDLFSAFT